jgi:hypothetical protein
VAHDTLVHDHRRDTTVDTAVVQRCGEESEAHTTLRSHTPERFLRLCCSLNWETLEKDQETRGDRNQRSS